MSAPAGRFRAAEAIVAGIGDGSTPSKRRGRRRIEQLQNALVEVMKHRAVTVADERRLTQLALAEPLDVQRPEAAARVLAAQKTAVEGLKQQLRDVNDRVEIKRRTRVEGTMRGLVK